MALRLVAAFAVASIAIVVGVYLLTTSGEVQEPLIPDTNLLAGEPWDGRGRGSISQTEAETFSDYPLLWLGVDFEGFNLQGISHSKYANPGPDPDMDEIVFIYGDCKLSGGSWGSRPSCPIPLSVNVRPVCYISPDEAGRHAYPEPPQQVRGEALILRRGGGPDGGPGGENAMIWTGDTLLNITSQLPRGSLDRMLNALQGIGLNEVEAGSTLPAPNFQRCGWSG